MKPPVIGTQRAPDATIALFAGAVVAFALALSFGAKFALENGLGWRCPVMAVAQFPCPSCGSTRALSALASFEWARALAFNPMIVLALPVGITCFAFKEKLSRYSRLAWPALLGAVVLNWAYLLLFLPR